jgi:FkbM family methyltransferase
VDLSNVSPAFERRDVDHLLRLIGGLLAEGRKVLFLDIGADLGTFAVTAGNRFKEFASFGLMAFEPAESSFALLKENISLNGLDSAASLNRTALWDADGLELDFSFNPQAPGSSVVGASGGQRVRTSKLDTALESYGGDYDALVMKMDVEGAERRVLDGARKTLSAGREAYLLVEDFVEPEIVAYLEREGWEFLAKKTPYNSFWRLRPSK